MTRRMAWTLGALTLAMEPMRFVAGKSGGPPNGRTCLPAGIQPPQRRFLESASGDEIPVGILSGTWPSAPLLSHLVRILIMEVIGYHAVIDERMAEYGGSPIYGLAGCINFNAPTDKKCGELETTMHVSTDSWVGGYQADFEQMQKDFPDIAPEDLGSVGYDGEETMYVSDAVFDAAYAQTGVILDHHKGYNRSHHNAKMFFDSVADIQLSELKLCSESELNNPSRMEPYAHFSGDTDGVVSSDIGVVAKCPDGYWWPSPACRHDITECIPLITGGNGWRIQALMQWATAYEMPLAVAVAKAWGNYVELISTKRVLFYWWVPDSTFIQMQPHQIHFPRHNPKEWAAGDKKTSLASSYIANMVSADLATKAPKVRSFMLNVRFSLLEIQAMLMDISLGDSKEKVACEWIKDNMDVWKEWIPVSTKCLAGFGMVDSEGEYLSDRENATGCDICKAGTFSAKFSDDRGKTFRCMPCTPGFSQENTYSSKCEPCARGMVSKNFGSESCTPCGVGEYQPNQAQTTCLPCNKTRTTRLLGATSQQECVCEAGFIEDGGLQCIPCPQGVLCPLGSKISKLLTSNGSTHEPRIQAGYSSEAVAPLETYRCPASDCPGGAPGRCGGGKVGATCGACPAGQFYLEEASLCKPCSDSIVPVLLCVGLSFLAVNLVASYYLLPSKYRAIASPTMMVSAIAGLTIATLQVLGVLATTVKDVTKSSGFLDAGRFFVLDGVGFSCAGTNTATFQMTVLFFWCIPWSFVLLGCISNVIPVLKKRHLAWEWRRTISLIGNFLQIGFTTMASIALVPFMCFKHPIGKFSVLKYPDIFCGSPEHHLMRWSSASLILLGTTFVSFCAVGVISAPAWSNGSEKRRLEMLTFLLHRFRPSKWWFGLVLLTRGTFVSLPAVFFANQPSLLELFMMVVLLLYLCMVVSCMPWKSQLLNLVDLSSTILLVILLGVFMSSDQEIADITDSLQLVISFSIMAILVLASLVFFANFFHRSIRKKTTDLWLVNLGTVPSPEEILIGLEDVADFMKDAVAQKDKIVNTFQQLSAFDLDIITTAIGIMQDELQMETSQISSMRSRINHSSRKYTRRSQRERSRSSGAATAPDTDTDKVTLAQPDPEPMSPDSPDASAWDEGEKDEMFPEGRQIIVVNNL